MNKYLEKIARMTSPLKAGIIMGGLGAGLGYLGKYKIENGRYTKKTKGERYLSAIATGGLLGTAGAINVHSKNFQEASRNAFKGAYRGGSRAQQPTKDLSTYVKEMGLAKVPKTKAEVHKHFKSQAMKHHPDRPTGDAKKMEALNAAYTKIKAHPDFEKLAQLCKVAEEKKPGWGKSFLAYLGGGTLGGVVAMPIQHASARSMMSMHANRHNQVGNGTTEREFLKKHNLVLDINKAHNHPLGPHFTYGLHKNIVNGSHHHGIQMHELGHALDLRHSNIGKHMGIQVGAGLAGTSLALKGIHDNNTAETVGGTYLSIAPILKREAVANVHAYKAFKEFEGKKVANKFLKQVALKNTLNYHTPVALTAAGLVAATKFIHRNDKGLS